MQMPPEHVAMRTILVKGLEWNVAVKSKENYQHKIQSEYLDWKLEKAVKIPENDKFMKFVCANVHTASKIVDKGLAIFNQRFVGKSLEKEFYINITPCFRCYQYDHLTKKCKTLKGIKYAQNALKGHRFSECKSKTKNASIVDSHTKCWHLNAQFMRNLLRRE